ncbi:MAG: chemotaxis protein CheW [Rhodomicrobium sp.]
MTTAIAPQLTAALPSPAAPQKGGGLKQFISFKIGSEGYAIDIMAVREIKGWTETTPLPNQPDYIRGVMNLRGTIIPVHDLRCRFGMGMTEASRSHAIIIVAAHDRMAGLLVDAVSDILTIDNSEISPVPEAGCGPSANYLSGIIPAAETMVVILALDQLLAKARTENSALPNEIQQAA